MLCSLTVRDEHKARPQIDKLKTLTATGVMTAALQNGVSVAVLLHALLESAASTLASAVVLDEKNRALCARDDAAHIELACEVFRQAATQVLAEARQQMLEPQHGVVTH